MKTLNYALKIQTFNSSSNWGITFNNKPGAVLFNSLIRSWAVLKSFNSSADVPFLPAATITSVKYYT
jgi:hypothetical protein